MLSDNDSGDKTTSFLINSIKLFANSFTINYEINLNSYHLRQINPKRFISRVLTGTEFIMRSFYQK